MNWSQRCREKQRTWIWQRRRLGQDMRLEWKPSVKNDHEKKVDALSLGDVVYGHYISVFMWSTNHIMCAIWLSDVINTDM